MTSFTSELGAGAKRKDYVILHRARATHLCKKKRFESSGAIAEPRIRTSLTSSINVSGGQNPLEDLTLFYGVHRHWRNEKRFLPVKRDTV